MRTITLMPDIRFLAAICLPLWLTAGLGCGTMPINGEPDLLLVEGKKLFEKKGYREARRHAPTQAEAKHLRPGEPFTSGVSECAKRRARGQSPLSGG